MMNLATLARLVARRTPHGSRDGRRAAPEVVVAEARQGGGGGLGSPRGYAGMGVEIALPIVLFMYLGYRMDAWLGSDPWLLSLGALLGVAVGFYGFIRRVLPPKQEKDRT
jgi:hypothetical protein